MRMGGRSGLRAAHLALAQYKMSGATNADSDLPTPPPVTRVDNLAPPVHTMQGSSAAPTTMREKRNWLIHLLYVRQDFHDCIAIIEEQLSECKGVFRIHIGNDP